MAKYLNAARLKAILEKLAPRFIDRDANHLLELADEVAGQAYDQAYDLVRPLDDRVTDVELNKADAIHTHAISAVTGLQGALDAKVDDTEKGAANGVATLGSDSKIPSAQLPALAVNDTFSVASEAAMLALTAQKGDFAIRTDLTPARTFVLVNEPASTLSNWTQIQAAYPNWGQISGTLANQTDLQTALNGKAASSHTHAATDITQTASYRFVTDTEKSTWNGKQNALGFTPLNKAGDTMTGDLGFQSATGTSKVGIGNGDGGSLATHNVRMTLHWGMGYAAYDGVVRGAFDARSGTWDVTGDYKVNGNSVWHAGNFVPSNKLNKAGDSMTGILSSTAQARFTSRIFVQDGTDTSPVTGKTMNMYYISGVYDGGVLQSYDYSVGAYKPIRFEGSGWTFHNGTSTVATIDSTGGLVARDISASRGDGTGVLYLNNTGSRYLYYDGSNYVMPGAALWVNNVPVLRSSTTGRVWVQSTDPGASAADGDLWFW